MYDVHSPAVPPVDVLRSKIKQFIDTGVLAGHPDRLWVNPDCGLKTRDWVEARSCLNTMWVAFADAQKHGALHDWKAQPLYGRLNIIRTVPAQLCLSQPHLSCPRKSNLKLLHS